MAGRGRPRASPAWGRQPGWVAAPFGSWLAQPARFGRGPAACGHRGAASARGGAGQPRLRARRQPLLPPGSRAARHGGGGGAGSFRSPKGNAAQRVFRTVEPMADGAHARRPRAREADGARASHAGLLASGPRRVHPAPVDRGKGQRGSRRASAVRWLHWSGRSGVWGHRHPSRAARRWSGRSARRAYARPQRIAQAPSRLIDRPRPPWSLDPFTRRTTFGAPHTPPVRLLSPLPLFPAPAY
mmetsp:Transcript_8493/g.27950  ORF Transcript_8493/g.27950 Transcript_8493/m.27950 type:complete len:242 (-) Transcript_8493:227-952(-)